MSEVIINEDRKQLGVFLKNRRELIKPNDVGLPSGTRRRTPGLRREEVAALAGVGLSWYTWLEQGRCISVSDSFLDNLSRVLKLDAAERRYLFLLAKKRLPTEPGKTWCIVPPLIHQLMKDLADRPAYVINLRWDVLAWNNIAAKIFNFPNYEPEARNMLWMMFTDSNTRSLFQPWDKQALQMLSSFRRDFVRATQDPNILELVKNLEIIDPDFKQWWQSQDVNNDTKPNIQRLNIKGVGLVDFEFIILTIDDNLHLRLVYSAAIDKEPENNRFKCWLRES